MARQRRPRLGIAATLLLSGIGTAAAQPAPPDGPPPAAPSTAPRAPEPAEEPPEDESTLRAREAFVEGTALAKRTRWTEALAAFERSAELKSHAVTVYNIGGCLRALGRYVLARRSFARALALDDENGRAQLSATLRSDTEGFIGQIDSLLARAQVTLQPASAAIAVDGRPLDVERDAQGALVLYAGTRPPGRGERPPSGSFELVLDPGQHVISLSRRGYKDAVVNRHFDEGTTSRLDLHIVRLPATMRVSATPDGAVVRVDGHDVGVAPIDVLRPGGTYDLSVEKDGYVSYESVVTLDPGQLFRIRADLPEETPALHERWWFWATLGGAAASVAVTTWYVVRPEPTRPPPDGGELGWVVEVPERAAGFAISTPPLSW